MNELIEIKFFNEIYKHNIKKIKGKNINILIYQLIRDSINLMVQDVINNTINNIKIHKIKNSRDIFHCTDNLVSFSNKYKIIEKEIKFFLRLKMYDNKKVLKKNNKGKKIIKKLFNLILKNPKKIYK